MNKCIKSRISDVLQSEYIPVFLVSLRDKESPITFPNFTNRGMKIRASISF